MLTNSSFEKYMLIVIVPMLVNKEVLELSYDLKFTIQNHDSFAPT